MTDGATVRKRWQRRRDLKPPAVECFALLNPGFALRAENDRWQRAEQHRCRGDGRRAPREAVVPARELALRMQGLQSPKVHADGQQRAGRG